MSEEKPTFKITDRRLFNTDGSPRPDVVREEPPAPAPAPPQAATPAPEAAAPAAVPGPAGRDESAAPPPAPEGNAAQAARADDAAAGLEPSQEFLMLTEFVAGFAADAMGMVNHPGEVGRNSVNLPLARQCIEMLGALREKTQGNLAGEEKQFLEAVLSQLRLQYVSLTSAPRPPQGKGGGPQGFSGGDITGGL